jgi:hypothetical protein
LSAITNRPLAPIVPVSVSVCVTPPPAPLMASIVRPLSDVPGAPQISTKLSPSSVPTAS